MSDRWSLRIWGRVAREVTFDLARLDALPSIEVTAQLSCADRDLRRVETFTGVAAREILGRIRLDTSAAFVLAHGADGFSKCLPLAVFAAADTLIARSAGGRPLDAHGGGPLRLIVPALGLGGSIKDLTGLEMLAKAWGQVSHGFTGQGPMNPWET